MTPEAYIGEVLVRVGLAVAGIIIGVLAHWRISRESRRRIDLPADLKAKVSAVDHMCLELDETFRKHLAKDAARAGRASQAAAAPAEAGAVPAGAVPGGSVVSRDLWEKMSAAQRRGLEAAGYAPAGGNGPAGGIPGR